jgi:hypothetical protein
MHKKLLALFCGLASIQVAIAHDDDQTEELKAYTPGVAIVEIEAEKLSNSNGEVEIVIAAIDLYGFDSPASTPADKQKVQEQSNKVVSQIANIVVFQNGACDFSLEELKPLKNKEYKDGKVHYYFKAEFDVTCAQPFNTQRINLNLPLVAPTVKNVNLITEMADAPKTNKPVLSSAQGIELK